MIPYPVTVGFAIGRLIRAFYRAAVRLTGTADRVHFCFTALDRPDSPDLPQGFANLLPCDYTRSTSDSSSPLAEYISRNRITTALALDLSVQAPCLPVIRGAGLRTVVSYWGAPMSSVNHGIKLALKRMEIRVLRPSKPDYFIFESEAMRHLATHGRGVAHDRTVVIPTGVDTDQFQPDSSHVDVVRKRFSIPYERKIFVYTGHLHRRKGVHVLIDAMVTIVRAMNRSDIHCLLLGNRPDEAAEFLAAAAPAAGFITLGGYQTDIPKLLAGCYAGVIPSTGWDSFPMSSLEMQACGLPVIASDCQGVPETIAPAVSGVVTPAGDAAALARAICDLADDSTQRDIMSRAARERIEGGFTLEHQVSRLHDFLRQVTTARSGAESWPTST